MYLNLSLYLVGKNIIIIITINGSKYSHITEYIIVYQLVLFFFVFSLNSKIRFIFTLGVEK